MDDAKLPTRASARATPAVSRIETGPLAVLRLFRPSDAEIAAASERLGFPLALEPLRVSSATVRSARLGPGEWLVFADVSDFPAKLGDELHQVHDVGHARTRWRLSERGGELLQRGCSLDLDPSAFPAGACARTLLAQVSVVIIRPSPGPEFELIGDSSLADYLDAWLTDAAQGLA